MLSSKYSSKRKGLSISAKPTNYLQKQDEGDESETYYGHRLRREEGHATFCAHPSKLNDKSSACEGVTKFGIKDENIDGKVPFSGHCKDGSIKASIKSKVPPDQVNFGKICNDRLN